jgi:adhesin/invasin
MIVFRNIRPPISNQFAPPNMTNPNQMKFVLKWDALPKDLDSHMYASNGTHIYYSQKTDGTMSLDYDVRSGYGPETITVTFQPGVKYVYAVHR